MNKFLLLAFNLFLCGWVTAQSLAINGNIIINEPNPEGGKIIISKNGEKLDEQILNRKGTFNLKLALGADYKIAFEKTGYITKIVSVNTEVPEEVLESNPNFPPVKLMINLFPSVEDVNLSIFEQPIAILAYNPELDDFTFDKDYSDKIKTKVAQTEQEIRRKLALRGSAALEQERKFAEFISKGQQAFDRKEWKTAIDSWTSALGLKANHEETKQKIANAQKEAELEQARRSIELQNDQAYKLLIASADSLFNRKSYKIAREKYVSATALKAQENYPASKIKEIDNILADLAKQEAENQKQLAASEATYQKTIALADQAFNSKAYDNAIRTYRQALELKPKEAYPNEMIVKAEKAITLLQQQQAADAEQKRLEEERRNSLKTKYTTLIAEADGAFKNENYSLAKLRYTEADQLNLGEPYPQKQLQGINDIINSSKYKVKLAEYNKNKTLAQKNREGKNYAAAKVYYQKALSILATDKEEINAQLAEIDQLIEAERLAAIEKEYKTHIDKADKAYQDKSYAVAKFYYQKALEVKNGEKYATERLKEVEKNIGERQEKEAEL